MTFARAEHTTQAMAPKRKTSQKRPFRVALTGGRTFLGERLVAALEEDPDCEHILVLDVTRPRSARKKTRFARLDLTNPSADEQASKLLRSDGIDTLCHLALLWTPSHNRSWAHELEAIGTWYLMNAAAESGVTKVLLSSTTMVYGAHANNPAFLTESHPLRGHTAGRWVKDKISAERELTRLAKERPKLVTTSLRFGIMLGPTVWGYFSRFLSRAAAPRLMGYDPLMQFVHEDDAVSALVKAVRDDHPGAYNIVGDGLLYYSDVIKRGGHLSLSCPHKLAYPLSTVLWNLQLVDTPGEFLNFFRFPWVADGRKMREEMGFQPHYSGYEALQAFHQRTQRQGQV